MKKIITLFAILALANCSTFLRNLATCEATDKDTLAALDQTKCGDCDAVYTPADDAGNAASCACPEGEEIKASVGCRKECNSINAIGEAKTSGYCKSCSGTWSNSACTCGTGTDFVKNKGCVEQGGDDANCTITNAETMKSADEAGCKACGLTYNATATDKCSCPESGEKIPTETLCKYCKKDWKDSKCSGFNLKIAYALFAVLFLL